MDAKTSSGSEMLMFAVVNLRGLFSIKYLTHTRTDVNSVKDEVKRFLTEHAPNAYGPREIAAAVGLAPSTIQGELNSLFKNNEIVKTSEGKYSVLPGVEGGLTPLPLQRVEAAARVWLRSTGMHKVRMLHDRPVVVAPEVVEALWLQKLVAECEVIRSRQRWKSDSHGRLEAALTRRYEADPSPHKMRARDSIMGELRRGLAEFNELGIETLELPKRLTLAALTERAN
jgi:hypothetical protein